MRIQNNITAMNTHRQYTINNDNVAKAAEKLSSGYRINRAADDAAGLAISEKMRSQIRGLNMATKNSQDAISLVQTAEGALQETHSMLQRMNELAVQAATGTNQEFDRTQAAKEFEQLKREINDVAEQTTFNNMKILDGSLSYTGPERSAATAGINVTKPTPTENVVPQGPVNEVSHLEGKAAGTGANAPVAGTAGVITVALDAGSGSFSAATTDELTLTVSVGGKSGTVKATPTTAVSNASTFADVFVGKTITIDGTDYAITKSSTNLLLTEQPKDGDLKGAAPSATANAAATATVTGGTITSAFDSANSKVTTQGIADQGEKAVNDKTEVTIDAAKLKVGDTITVGSDEIKLDANNWSDDGTKTLSDLKTLIDAKIGTGDFTTTVTGDSLTIEAKGGKAAAAGAGSTKVTWTGANSTSQNDDRYTMEFDIVKMRPGDSFTFTKADGTSTAKVEYESGMTGKEFAEKVATALGETPADIVKGNAIVVDWEISANLDKADWGATSKPANAMMIQVGALENEQLAISIDSMNTAGLHLDGQNLDNQINAGKAITAVRNAVNQVSDQRATLGAMQNRLDHKIANLKVSSENLSAAESRIRDVDMASEMTNFTKNNILSQAATAMLAQANALPQNVLSLLG